MRGSTPIVLFGAFVQGPRGTPDDCRRRIPATRSAGSAGPLEPFDALVFTRDSMRRRRRCATLPCSVALHSGAALGLIALPLLAPADLPGPAGAVATFFAAPIVAPPPPPAPPGRPSVARPVATQVPEAPARFTAPVEVPSELRPEDGLDLGVPAGAPGGVEGGVPGGVVGGIVGGLPEAPEEAPPPVTPLRVGGQIREPRRTQHVAPVYPQVALDAGLEGIVIIEAVVDEEGRVDSARVLRGIPILDDAALGAVRQWRYTPTLLDGVPTPVIMTITVTFKLKRTLRP